MSDPAAQEAKYKKMVETPIPKLVVSLAVPTIISMMVTSIYNMADTFFVGQIGTSATGAVGVVFSLMAIIQAIGFTLGMGSGNYISRLLGQRDHERAQQVASTGFVTALIVGAVVAVLGLIFIDPLVRMLGATETILPHARAYAQYILIGAPYMAASFVLNNILRFQGNAIYAMVGLTAGGVLNIILDPIFIFGLGMGTGGAALATIISQFVSFLILFYNCQGKGGGIKVRFTSFKPCWSIYKEILRGGLPSFYRQGLASISTICLNLVAGPFGDAAIAAMSIVGKVFMFAFSILLGFGQGFQPVCGFNYGAQRYDRVLRAFWFCVKVGVILLAVLAVGGVIFAPQLVELFRKGDAEVVAIGVVAMRWQAVVFPLSAWVTMCNMLLQAIGKGTKASILAMARQGIFFLPLILVLPHTIGLLGVQISQPIADVCTFLLAVPLTVSVLRELKQQMYLQPGYDPETETMSPAEETAK